MNGFWFTIIFSSFMFFFYIISSLMIKNIKKKYNIEKTNGENDLNEYRKPELKKLTKEQIKEIHSKGLITPEEKVKEWEMHDICAPGDAIGSASNRCKKFNYNCHDCLVDYSKKSDEYVPIERHFKIINYLNL